MAGYGTMRNHAHMTRRLRTATYPPEARARLGAAVSKAREAAGYKYRSEFARAHGISLRSLELLEAAQPGVGQSVLFAVGRALPRWDEDTPRHILEGGDPPPSVTEVMPKPERTEPEDGLTSLEREIYDSPDLSADEKDLLLRTLRRARERSVEDPPQRGRQLG